MRFKHFGLLLTGIATASAGANCATQSKTSAGAIMAENAWVRALEHRDSEALDCVLDPTFTDNDWRGQQASRETVLGRLPKRPPSILHLSDLKATIEGSMAAIQGLNSQVAPDGKIVGTVRFTDVFIYREHRWRAVAAQETLVRSAR